MLNWKKSTTQDVGVERIQNINEYLRHEDQDDFSPIDRFYNETQLIITTTSPEKMADLDWIGTFFIIATVSTTENYFRNVLCKILKLCPIAQKNAAQSSINLGSVIWHPTNEIERGAFEHKAFSDVSSIKAATKSFTGIDISNKQELKDILAEFDKVCELRHSIVHSGRVLAGKNAVKLKIPSSTRIIRVLADCDQIQEVVSICTTLVVSYNKLMFEELCRRWAIEWRRSPSWDNTKEGQLFKQIWQIFYSKHDANNGQIPSAMSWVQCKNQVKREFQV